MKSARTRARLQQVGLDLISEIGYDAATVEQIATAAGVSHMTFFRHFPTKQSLVLDDPFDPAIAAAVGAQPSHLTALQRACRGVRDALAGLDLLEEQQTRMRVRIGATTPTLTAGMWANTVATQTAIADALRTSSPADESRIAAAATVAALTAALLDWGVRDDSASLVDQLMVALRVLDPEPAA